MANTERLAVLAKVRVAKQEVNTRRADNSISDRGRGLLEEAYTVLDEVEDHIILQEIGSRINELKAARAALGKVTAKMDTDVKKIQKVVELVDDAAQALKALANIAAAAAAAGLLRRR